MRRMPFKSILLDFLNRLGLQSSSNTDTQVYFITKMPYNAQDCSSVDNLSVATRDTISWKLIYETFL
jgi:hypothetical protein